MLNLIVLRANRLKLYTLNNITRYIKRTKEEEKTY